MTLMDYNILGGKTQESVGICQKESGVAGKGKWFFPHKPQVTNVMREPDTHPLASPRMTAD